MLSQHPTTAEGNTDVAITYQHDHPNRHGSPTTPAPRPRPRPDAGFNLIELLIVVVVLGVLVAAVLVALGGISTQAAETGCEADVRTLDGATYLYLSDHDQIPPTGVGPDRYERTLVAAGLIRAVSEFHDVDADGAIVRSGAPC